MRIHFRYICRLVICGCALVFCGSGCFSAPFSQTELRSRIEDRIKLERLREWSYGVLEADNKEGVIDLVDLPDDIRRVSDDIYVSHGRGDIEPHILVVISRGHHHTAVYIGKDSFVPPDQGFELEEWIPGVWGAVEN